MNDDKPIVKLEYIGQCEEAYIRKIQVNPKRKYNLIGNDNFGPTEEERRKAHKTLTASTQPDVYARSETKLEPREEDKVNYRTSCENCGFPMVIHCS